MDRSIVAFSSINDAKRATEEVIGRIEGVSLGRRALLIIFSSEYGIFSDCAGLLHEKFPDTTVIGSTTHVVFGSAGYAMQGLCALAVFEGIKCADGVLLEAKRCPMRYAPNVIDAISQFDDTENLACFEFTSAHCKCDELVMDTIKSVHKKLKLNIPVYGSTAGAVDETGPTLISLNGDVFEEACVFVYIKNLCGRIIACKENIFKPTENVFKITDIECDDRCIYELNNKNAVCAISDATGIAPKDVPGYLTLHPFGRIDGDDVYITAMQKVHEDGRITMLARVYNETECALLELDDIESIWNQSQDHLHEVIPNPSFGIAVNCIARTKYFMQNGLWDAFVDKAKMSCGTFFGIAGFGEQFLCEHLNMTCVAVLFE